MSYELKFEDVPLGCVLTSLKDEGAVSNHPISQHGIGDLNKSG